MSGTATPQLCPVLIWARPEELTSSRRLVVTPMNTCASWLFGSTVVDSRRTLPSTSPAPITLIRAVWLTWSLAMSRVGTMPTRSNSPRAMIENSASPLLPVAGPPTDGIRGRDHPAHRRLHRDLPALGQGQPRQHLARGDAVARIDHHLGHLQPEPLGPNLVLLARHDDAGDLDDIGEAGFRGLEHGDRRALQRRLAVVGGGKRREAGKAEQACGNQGGEPRRKVARSMGGHRQFPLEFRVWDTRKRASQPSAKNVTPPPG